MTVSTPTEIFGEIDSLLRADPQRASGISASYQFDLTGDGGGTFHVVMHDGTGRAGTGPVERPDTVVAMAAADLVDLRSGRLDATMAFMSGKIKITGDTGLAMRLVSVLRS